MPEEAISNARAQFLRTDDPAVRENGDASRSCASCGNWSQWLGETGDCLLYAYRRREALLATRGSEETAAWRAAWPRKGARTTSASESCDGWVQVGSVGR
jgi:hypothetical protein